MKSLRWWGSIVAATALALGAPSAAAQSTPLTGASLISGGGAHTCAVLAGGAARCWGSNSTGQLGDNSTTDRPTPVAVTGLASGVSAIAAGGQHTCAVVGGGVKCWGANSSGQLGDGSNTRRLTPVDVSGLTSGVTAISAGAAHTCALTTGGGVKCWGFNSNGQLGDNSTSNRLTPVNVAGLASGVTSIAAGYFHTCAVASGAVKCWGDNFVGELGNDSSDESHVPVDVTGLGSGASTVAVGLSHSCALMTSGGVKCWGLNFNGQLGDGGIVQLRRVPGDVTGLSGIAALVSNGNTVCVLTGAGGVKCWGANDSGQIGDNSITQRDAPVDVNGLTAGVAAIALGDSHACARLTATGAVCWGINTNGQLGNATTASSQVTVTVLQQPSAGPVISVNPASVSNGTVGVVYPAQTLSGSGGQGPYTFAVTGGNPPPGLTLTSAGVLGGMPTAAGSFSFTVTATDSTPGASGGPFSGVRTYGATIGNPGFLDVDGNGVYDASTDGLIVMRYLFKVYGSPLTDGAIGGGATRTDPGAILAYLDNMKSQLDIDGNGRFDALTDGVLIVRYMLGKRGDELVTGAVGVNAIRDTAQIQAYLQSLMP